MRNSQNAQQSETIPVDTEGGNVIFNSSPANRPACGVAKGLASTPAGDAVSNGTHEPESEEMAHDQLKCLSKRELIGLIRLRECQFDEVDLRGWTAAIVSRLTLLRKRAREGKCVDEASEFSRWIVQSGLIKLFHGSADRRDITTLISDTLWDCQCHWKNQGREPWVARSELEALNAKLDLLMQQISPRINETASAGRHAVVTEPAMQVITGGLS